MKRPKLQEITFGNAGKVEIAIVPDGHGHPSGKSGNLVCLARSTAARLFREWRREGGRVREGQPLASMILWLALSGMEIVKSKK
jgi:hypothetical protein